MVTDVEAMNTGRRLFLGGLLATGLAPVPTWADAGSPAYLSAAMRPDGSYVLCGVGATLDVVFEIALPARGHAAAGHPSRPEAVAFARRPGTFAIVIDCLTGTTKAMLHAPAGRHFYGHGAYSADGHWLFTTENDYENGRGRVGVWDVAAGYERADEFDSGGIGPHDIKRLPDTDTLVVANGGIDTHPDSGRTKLNIPTMRPNLAYLERGHVVEIASLPSQMHKNSIRHLAVASKGDVAFGMQWQGEGVPAALLGVHRQGGAMVLIETPAQELRTLAGYIGSIAFSEDATTIGVTSPRGGLVQLYDRDLNALRRSFVVEDVCGIAPRPDGFTVTSGTGALGGIVAQSIDKRTATSLVWDNHLVAV